MPDKSRPLVISMCFHPEPAGSALPISGLAAWMARNGVAPHVISARPNYPDRIVYEGYRNGERDNDTFHGALVTRLKSRVMVSSGTLGRLITELSFLWALVSFRLRRGHRADVVISVCPSIFTVLGAQLFRARGGRHLAIVHDIQSGLGVSTGRSRLAMAALARLERWVLNRVDGIVTLTSNMGRALQDSGVDTPILVLPPQVDTDSFPDLPESGGRLAVYSGAMGRKQGLELLVQAADVLRSRGSDIRLVLRGQSGVRPELEAMVADLGLTNITFEPLAPEARYHEVMAEACIHLVPQDRAGADFALPSKVYSIMASHRPFIATALPGSPLARLAEESGAGVIVPPSEPELLVDALVDLMENAPLRRELGRSGRDYVERCADSAVVCAQIWRAACGDGPNTTAQENDVFVHGEAKT